MLLRRLVFFLMLSVPQLAWAQLPLLPNSRTAGSVTPPLSHAASFALVRPGCCQVAALPRHPEADALVAEMRRDLDGLLLSDNPRFTQAALAAARALLTGEGVVIDAPQVVLVVDRSVAVQRLWTVAVYPAADLWVVAGQVRVSTGKPGRKEHFRTPVGVFENGTGVLGYRAQGTYNENHILGNGTRGMRVWDFGWQTTDDWRTPGALMAVRLEMHATDPAVLEPRLGRADSEGCIRIPSRFDSFLDQHGLIDAELREAAQTQRRFAALLPKDVTPSPLAGHLVVVVDTSDPAALPSDPVRASAMEAPPLDETVPVVATVPVVGAGREP